MVMGGCFCIYNQSCTQSLYRTLTVVDILMRFYRDVACSVPTPPFPTDNHPITPFWTWKSTLSHVPIKFTCVMQNSAEVENVQGNLPFSKESFFANEHLFCSFALLCCKAWRKEQNSLLKLKNVCLGCCINSVVISRWSATTLISLSVSVCVIVLVHSHSVNPYVASFFMS